MTKTKYTANPVQFEHISTTKIRTLNDAFRKTFVGGSVYITPAVQRLNEINAFKTQVISEKCSALSIECSKVKNFNESLNIIKNSNQKFFLITGSLYLVGKIRPKFFIN